MKYGPTIRTYDKYAEVYDQEVIEFWNNFPESFVDDFCDLMPGKRVLDLGSGSGRDALLLRDKGMKVICIDGSKAMVEITNKLEFESIVSTFDQLEFMPRSFDGVWAYTSLLHIPKSELSGILGKIHTWLSPKGMFALGMIEGEGENEVIRDSMPGEKRLFAYYKSEELIRRVESCGFNFLAQVDYQPHNTKYINQLFNKR